MLGQEEINVLRDIWNRDNKRFMVCPKCGGSLTVVQLGPKYKPNSYYTPYETVIECDSCDFKMKVESFTIFGAVRDFDDDVVEISSWSPTGNRIVSSYKNVLDKNLLQKLKESGELVEFLIVDDYAVVVIG